MLSNMESNRSDDATAVLRAAEDARRRMSGSLRLPSGLFPALAAAVALQVGTAAYGISVQTLGGLAIALGGVAVFLALAAFLLHRFRQANGVRVDGLSSQIVLGSRTTASVVYVAAMAAATWAAFEEQWWLTVVAAVAGGIGYALDAQRWWVAYRLDPAGHAGGASPRVLAGLAVVACVGLVVLVVLG
jgi:hypothetical protein